jgi:hypothetical protein
MSSVASEDYVSFWTAPADMPSRTRSAVRAVLFAREPDLHPQMRDRVLREVLWFATEVPGKYTTRYRSIAAWELQRKSKRVLNGWVLSRTSMSGLVPGVACDCCPLQMLSRSKR